MQVQRIAVAGATVLSLLAWSTGSAAETEPDAVRQLLAEMEKLKERVSRLERENRGMRETNETQAQRIQQLEADVQEQQRLAEQREAAEGEDPAALEADAEAELEELLGGEEEAEERPTGLAGTLTRAFQTFNPDISVIGDFVGHYSSREGGELDDEFLFRELELGFSGPIDPYARADVFLGIHRHGGDWELHVEEAYATFLTMPFGLQAKAGVFRAGLGKINTMHLHSVPWVTYPNIVRNYFGEEGLFGTGVGISWLVPNRWDKYIELSYEVFNNDSGTLFAGQEADDFVHLGHLKTFLDLSPASTLELGASFATAPNDEGHGANRSMIEGLDVTYKWRPPEKGRYRSLLWQTELLAAQADLIGGQETSWGMYSGLDYQFARRWSVGARYDYSQMPTSSSRHEQAYSAFLTFLQSEYLFWRLGYVFTERDFRVGGDDDEHEIFLQMNWGIGPHRAHKY